MSICKDLQELELNDVPVGQSVGVSQAHLQEQLLSSHSLLRP